MIDRAAFQHALERRAVAEWAVVEREQELAVVDDGPPRVRRSEERTRWQVAVHVDTPTGRGSARVELDANDASPEAIVERAVAVARATAGPAWATVALAAPARVPLVDEDASRLSTLAAAEAALQAPRPANAQVTATARCMRERVNAIAHGGFRTDWTASAYRVDAIVTVGERSLAIAREARRQSALELGGALAAAARDVVLLATAAAPVPGPCALVLAADAMVGDGLGVWEVFAFQADALVERQGLTRYRDRMPVVRGADTIAEPLSIASDGALPYGVRSAPIGDEGDAVRTFAIIDHGRAADLGMGPREAALRGLEPNGGVRNLVVATGSWAGDPGAAKRVVEVRRLRDLAIDPHTGEGRLELALALDGGKPFSGGTIRLDLISALALAQRSAVRIRRGAYDGPDSVFIESAEIVV